jgi:prepilin-type N-terminal cleavage/methylation domain-containing protein
MNKKGFTLIEILLVLLVTLATSVLVIRSMRNAIDKGKIGEAVAYAKLISEASDLYRTDMGFYPPDVNRGCDPGFDQPLPTEDPTPGAWDCAEQLFIPQHHPANWQDEIDELWLGPYIKQWERETPWGGKYDFNFWPNGAVRSGECVAAGIYIGIQGDYSNNNTLPTHVEQRMLDDGVDRDGVLNGEAQMFVQHVDTTTPVCTP